MMQTVYPNMKLFTIYYRDKEEKGMPERWVGYIRANSEEELRRVFLKDNPTCEITEVRESEERS